SVLRPSTLLCLCVPVSHSQITRLYSRFHSLDKGENGALSREDFQRIPELAINPLGDRIINAFFPEGVATFNNIVVFSYFFAVAFRLYDLDRDDKISRDELLQVLEKVDVEQKMSIRFLH
uniref:Calcineurin-like EF-hand protein 1 n=1 Tax=Sinocyclocheilus anshuiensis TaxID=1608454 RepID=A0A671KE34_9TELE